MMMSIFDQILDPFQIRRSGLDAVECIMYISVLKYYYEFDVVI